MFKENYLTEIPDDILEIIDMYWRQDDYNIHIKTERDNFSWRYNSFIDDRMHKSIQKLAPKDMKVTITNPGNRQHTCWIGGSTISSLKAFSRYWVTKRQYEEEGGYRALLVQSM